jgi:hypothetical protein
MQQHVSTHINTLLLQARTTILVRDQHEYNSSSLICDHAMVTGQTVAVV